jgi:hypothetical protein
MPLSAILFITLCLAPYAYGAGNDHEYETVHIEVADRTAVPSATFFGRAIGSVTPGDLFYIDATTNTHDISVNLYLNNAHELTPYLRYLILKVGIYSEGGNGQWQKASLGNGNPVPDTFITLRNSPVGFTLAGGAKYKVTVNSGSFYCLTANINGGITPPQFYLTVEPV